MHFSIIKLDGVTLHINKSMHNVLKDIFQRSWEIGINKESLIVNHIIFVVLKGVMVNLAEAGNLYLA